VKRCLSIAEGLFDTYLFGNVHIALCAVALTKATEFVLHLHIRNELLAFVFCATLFGYNLQRLPTALRNRGVHPKFRRHHWNSQHPALLTVLSVLSATAFAWSASRIYRRSQIVALVPAALSFTYAFPIIPIKQRWIELREIPGIKIFVIATSWACSCVLIPVAAAHRDGLPWLTIPAALWGLACGLLTFALTVPFDIRDLRCDDARLRTLPGLLGVRASIAIAIGALLVSAAILWIVARHPQALAYSVWCVIASFFIYKSSPERHEYYFSFLTDGLLVLLWGIFRMTSAMT